MSELGQTYDTDFYDDLSNEVRASAEVIVPLVVELLRPQSVLDVGCGRGTWLRVFQRHGVTRVLGVDGPHVSPADLEIPPEAFVSHDLRTPIAVDEAFDLAISLEVGEHLDAELAPTLVASLVERAPAVLFSAAIPFQGGAGHVNEQWPSYWRDLFATHGYEPVDAIRPRVWTDTRVAFWYAQNTILYVDPRRHPRLVATGSQVGSDAFDLVHPALHTRDHTKPKTAPAPLSLRRVLHELPGATVRAVRGRGSRPRGTQP
jgi:SAM-dependent methyltransferase